MEKKKLNIGCGRDYKVGYVNLDYGKHLKADVYHDLDKFPWPFKDNEFDEVFCSHVLEHVEDFVKTMSEIKRICKHGAKIIIRVPHFSCCTAYWDPTHKTFFSHFTFDYFTKRGFYGFPEFEIIKRRYNFTRENMTFLNYIFNPIINASPTIYERFLCWMLPCSELICVLRVKK